MNQKEDSQTVQHTPKPWKYNADSQNIVFDGGPESTLLLDPYDPKYSTGDDATDDWYIGSVGGHWCDRPSEEIDANGVLMAAAPDLLEALEAMLEDCGQHSPGCKEYPPGYDESRCCSVHIARAAIAKARGEGA